MRFFIAGVWPDDRLPRVIRWAADDPYGFAVAVRDVYGPACAIGTVSLAKDQHTSGWMHHIERGESQL